MNNHDTGHSEFPAGAPRPAIGACWPALAGVSALAIFFYLLMEWVFFATKPSFMSVLGTWERVRILLLAPLPLVLASTAACAALGAAGMAFPKARETLVRVGLWMPGFVLGAAFLLLWDNFTYTLFGVGVQTAEGAARFGYLALFLVFWGAGWRLAMGMWRGALAWRRPARTMGWWALALVVVWGGLLASGPEWHGLEGEDGDAEDGWPNILLLASDGLDADRLSLYGYERDTTPFIRRFAEGRALVGENAFANAVNSGSSVASMLTGKLPTTLRLYYPPEILTGRNAYEHLPGILRQRGYETIDISARHFADAYDLNLRHAFHEANGRVETRGRWQAVAGRWLGMGTGYFLGNTWERLRDRLLHAAGVREFDAEYERLAGEAAGTTQDDEPRIERLARLVAGPRTRPFFAHVHLLETHGPFFPIRDPVFSAGQTQEEAFERDFYDDAVLQFDAAFGRIIGSLEAAGELENTVVVLTSDHGMGWNRTRIPLVFWFPEGAHAGRIRANAQLLDIAPTLLDYLGIDIPEWMEGVSLLDGEPPEDRPVFSTAVAPDLVETRKWALDLSRLKPPFYSLGLLAMTVGDRIYALELTTGELSVESVAGHAQALEDDRKPDDAVAREMLLRHLEGKGYPAPAAWRAMTAAEAGE
jgi:arylsulfatase A-like enzyme